MIVGVALAGSNIGLRWEALVLPLFAEIWSKIVRIGVLFAILPLAVLQHNPH
jgi:hypothetical protein